jgi:hypothetical protein
LEIEENKMIYCNQCDSMKNNDEFYLRRKSKSGYQSTCKECQLKFNREHIEHIKRYGPTIHKQSKVCRICNNEKPVSQFGKRSNKADGLMSYCKPCWAIYVKKAKNKKNVL